MDIELFITASLLIFTVLASIFYILLESKRSIEAYTENSYDYFIKDKDEDE